MRNRFDEEMTHLHTMMTEMGALCESAIASAVKAILEEDTQNGERAIGLEEEINNHERSIEALCLKLLLRQQPVAKDLRQISAALKMVTDMERIGDQASDIAEIARLGNVKREHNTFTIKEMSIAAINMVTECIDAYVHQDVELAKRVIQADDVVDRLFNEAKRELTIMLISEPRCAECVIDLLMVAKYLERIGDHAVNVAQWVGFAVTGQHLPDHPEREGEMDGEDLPG